jgi:hypothetical protein
VSLAACEGGAVAPVVPVTQSITVDASTAFAYLRLDDTAQVVPVSDPATSEAWDIGFFATTVTLNGGAAGPGGVTGYCVCNNAAATNEQIATLTPESELAAFEGVTAAAIPAASAFQADTLAPAISGWSTGTPGSGAVTPTAGRAWILREGTSTVILGKFQVTAISGNAAAGPTSVTFEYALQPAPGQPFGAVQSRTVTLTPGAPVYFDLSSGAEGSPASWDLRFEGWTIRLNSGVSGSGTLRAVLDTSTPFASIDAGYAATAPAQAFRGDAYSGVFAGNPWYRYNITGTDNQIWPTYNVYLVRRGTAVFRVQLTGYYGPGGQSRQITVRYARLTQ